MTPYVWQALNVALVVLGCFALAHRSARRCIGGDGGDAGGVHQPPALRQHCRGRDLNIALLLFVMWAVLRRANTCRARPGVAVLGVLISCSSVPRGRRILWALRLIGGLCLWKAITSRYLVVACAVATGTIAASRVIFEILGISTSLQTVESLTAVRSATPNPSRSRASPFRPSRELIWVTPPIYCSSFYSQLLLARGTRTPERLVYFSAVSALGVGGS